ncbi:serine carboxypeptidase-like 51 isoform X3 [Miscanthus floridulus]|uniref:serine carboxypeptidase-like 51 isoform X3 n=1 Tax=Miscanthus floridulus TaxID=154761 RepID=UPI003457ADED
MDRSRYHSPLALLPLHLLLCLVSFHACCAASITTGTPDGSELWGYVEVRPRRVRGRARQLPGDGAAGRRPQAAQLDVAPEGRPHLCVLADADADGLSWRAQDNPVGTGYSYVEDDSLFVTSDWQQAEDATTLLRALVKEVPTLATSPLFLVAESYGGKYAATLGASVARAVRAGELNVTLGGVALGDSWISPEDFTLSYTPLLLSVSRLDDNAGDEANKKAETVKDQIVAAQWAASHRSWASLLDFIDTKSGNVDVYNFMLDSGMDPVALDIPVGSSLMSSLQAMKYSTSHRGQDSQPDSNTIDGIMNGVIKQKLKIIPKNFTWRQQSDSVYHALVNDFMKPRIDEIDELLSYGVNVTVYNGQLDVICSTNGAEAWVQKLKWDGLKSFLSLPRQPLYCGASKGTKAFVRSYKNLHFYWILGAGHYVPADQPCIALSMISSITQSPAS